jgi:hypothetical protein
MTPKWNHPVTEIKYIPVGKAIAPLFRCRCLTTGLHAIILNTIQQVYCYIINTHVYKLMIEVCIKVKFLRPIKRHAVQVFRRVVQ